MSVQEDTHEPQNGVDPDHIADPTTPDSPSKGLPESPPDPDVRFLDACRERDESREQFLRKAAEFENYRKRVERERKDFVESAAHELLLELLPILDNFERALLVGVPAGAERYRDGVELICKQLQDLLKKRGVTPIDATGSDFDPREHQAVVQEVSAEHRDNEVMAELQRGYRLGERLLRPAMVKVARRE